MNRIHRVCARVALVTALAAIGSHASATVVSGPVTPDPSIPQPVASTPPEAGAALVRPLFALTGEAAVVVGRTFFTILGMGIETLPPRAFGPVVPLLPK